MKIITANALKKMINEYALSEEIFSKNFFIHEYYKAIWDARMFGVCIIRQERLWKKFIERQKQHE